MSKCLIGLILAISVVLPAAHAQNLLTNGDWSTGDETGWTRWQSGQGVSRNWHLSSTGSTTPEGTAWFPSGPGGGSNMGWYQTVAVTPGAQVDLDADWEGNISTCGWAEVMLFSVSTGTGGSAIVSRIDAGNASDIAYKKDSWGLNPPSTWGWQDASSSPMSGGNGGTVTSNGLIVVALKLGGSCGIGSIHCRWDNLSLTLVGGSGLCGDNRVANPDFQSGSSNWTQWTESGSGIFDFNDTANVPLYGAGSCLRMRTNGGFFNGGAYQALNLQSGGTYQVHIASRDVGSIASGAWTEVLIGTSQPQNGSDYSSGTPGASLLLKWDTWTCDNWNGTESSACVQQTTSFTASASTMYLVLKTGGWPTDVSFDNVEICGPAPCTPPTAPTSASSDRSGFCADDPGNITLTASGGSGDTLRWFTGSCGGTQVGTGTSLVIASPTATTTYYARWENTCDNSACVSTTVTVHANPDTPTNAAANPSSIIAGGSSTLSASVSGAVIDWYTGSCGGTLVGTGNSINVSPSATTTYYALARNSTTGCESTGCDAVTVTVTANVAPANDSVSVSSTTLCPDDTTEYTITHVVSDANGVSDIRSQRILLDLHFSPNWGRGYLTWGQTDADVEHYGGNWTKANASGGGRWGFMNDDWGYEYITPVSCSTSTNGNARTVVWTIRIKDLWGADGPATGNFVGMYAHDAAGSSTGWVTSENAPYSVTFDVPSNPQAPGSASVDRDNFCSDDAGSISLTASGGSGTDLTWYAGSCGGSSIGTGSPLVIDSPTTTTTYYARWENVCEASSCASVTVTVPPTPADPSNATASPSTLCEGETSTLTASVSGAQIDWYADSCGGTMIGTGNSIDVSPSVTTTFYARARDGGTGCESVGCSSVTVTVNPRPATPTNAAASPDTICSGESVNLTASVSGAVVDWYNDSCGGTLVGTGNSINVSPAASTTYYARARDATSGCESTACETVNVTVHALPSTPTNAQATPSAVCNGGTVTLSASASGAVIDWYTGGCGGTLVGTGNSIDVTPNATTTYYAKARDGGTGCESIGCDDVTVTVHTPPATPTNALASPDTVCQGGTSTLSASVSGAVIDWYTGSCGGTLIGTGNSIDVTPTVTTTYYARARDTTTGCGSDACMSVTVTVDSATPPSTPGDPADDGRWVTRLVGSSAKVYFAWSGSSADCGLSHYNVQIGTSPGGSDVFDGTTAETWLAADITSVADGSMLYARVQAEDTVGNVSAWSGNSDGIEVVADDADGPMIAGEISGAITIDGSPSEADWANAGCIYVDKDTAQHAQGLSTTGDLNYRLRIIHDGTYVYLLVQSADDDLSLQGVSNPGENVGQPWDADAIELYFDGDHSASYPARTSQEYLTGGQLNTSMRYPDENVRDAESGLNGEWGTGTGKTWYSQVERNDLPGGGFTAVTEWRVEKSRLGSPASGSEIGFDIRVFDGPNQTGRLAWADRNSSGEAMYNDERAWADLYFDGCAPPVITQQPQNQAECEASGATFAVSATGTGLSYQWYKNGQPVGTNSSTLELTNLQASDDGASVDVEVSSNCGNVTSDSVTLSVARLPVLSDQPEDQTKCVGDWATFAVGPFTGYYYNSADFTGGLVLARPDREIDFSWGGGSPDPLIQGDPFSVRWVGKVIVDYSETYTFYTVTDDGVRLYVDGQLIIDQWIRQVPTEYSAQVSLTAGQIIEIEMEYYEETLTADATLSWSSPSLARENIIAPPDYQYQWRKDGLDIPGATGPSYTVYPITLADAATYDCVVTNACGSITSDAGMLSVEEPIVPPVDDTATALATDRIEWTWQDTDGEHGYFIKTPGGTDVSGELVPDTVVWEEASGLSPNTQYTRHVHAYNVCGEVSSEGRSRYTLIETPLGVAFGPKTPTSIDAGPDGTLSNITAGLSGVLTENLTATTDSGWVGSTGYWLSEALTPNASYSFQTRARNGDGIETAITASADTYTLAAVPSIGNNVTCDRSVDVWYPEGTTFTFTNPAVFGAGAHGGSAFKVSAYRYVWDMNPTYEAWTGSEAAWSEESLELTPSQGDGQYWLHLQSRNVEGEATPTTLDYGPFKYDSIFPGVTVEQGSDQADPALNLPIVFDVVFNETVTDFSAEDIVFSGTAQIAEYEITGGGTDYQIRILQLSGAGTIVPSIPAARAHDEAGNANFASTSQDNVVDYPTTKIQNWYLAVDHGHVGEMLTPIVPDGEGIYTEPRRYAMRKIVAEFNRAVGLEEALAVDCATIQDTQSQCYAASAINYESGTHRLVIHMPGDLPNAKYYDVDVGAGLTRTEGASTWLFIEDSTIRRIRLLIGDVNSSNLVEMADIGIVKTLNRQNVDQENYRYDVNCDGRINLIDAGVTRFNLNREAE